MPVSAADCLLVALGGAAGSVARYLVGGWIAHWATVRGQAVFPWGILAVNVTGCFLLGWLMAFLLGRTPGTWNGWRPLLAVGFLGGYTTFSTLMYDVWRLGPRTGLLNLALSAAAGYVAVWLGTASGGR